MIYEITKIHKVNHSMDDLLNLIKKLSIDKIYQLMNYIKSSIDKEYELFELINNGFADKILNIIKNLSSNKYTTKDYDDYYKVVEYMSKSGDSGGSYSRIIDENVPGALDYRWKPYGNESDNNLNELLIVLDELIPILKS